MPPPETVTIDDRLSALEELDREQREGASEHLTDFCCYVDTAAAKQYRAKHLRYLAGRLEAVERGEVKRLMIFMPPRHWKSSLTSEKFAAWFLGRNPKKSIISTSHSGDLCKEFSRNIRDMIATNPRWEAVFPNVRLQRKSRSVVNWALMGAYRSTYRAAGVGGGITGRGADLILIDDPVADHTAVATKNLRDKLYTWYQMKLRNRLEPGGAIILIMTRWHEDDLAGRLIEAMNTGEGEEWEIICLPAVAEPGYAYPWTEEARAARQDTPLAEEPSDPESPTLTVSPSIIREIDEIGRSEGEPLWPERWDLKSLRLLQKASGPRAWAALFQQRPRPDGGSVLDSSKLIRIAADKVPPLIRQCRNWDLAFSEPGGGDRMVGAKLGVDRKRNVYILHIKVLEGRWPVNKPKILQTAEDDGLQCVVSIEANGTQVGYYQDIHDDIRMKGYRVIKFKPTGTKEMRASVWGSKLEDAFVYVVKAGWNQMFFDEMDGFPNGEHDDQIDGVSGGWEHLMTLSWFQDKDTLEQLLKRGEALDAPGVR